MKRRHLPESPRPGKRLGRHVAHDPRSKAFHAPCAPKIVTTRHARGVPIFDQGSVGSCTGNALAGMLSTAPFAHAFGEADALAIYAAATHFDGIDGVFPPDDTGSNSLAVMKVAVRKGWIRGYHHAFGLDHVLRALVLTPGICGMAWREGCDSPNVDGVITYSGAVRGGHELELVGLDAEAGLVWMANSWGPSWGKDGYFAMTFSDFAKALNDNGDATFAVA